MTSISLLSLIKASMLFPYAAAESADDWTWSEAGEQALYGLVSVFLILIVLTLLTALAGRIVPRFEKGRNGNNEKKH